MVATVFPLTASQSVTWSIVPGTGGATISSGGLVTATANGTVYAKAVAVQDVTVKDSLLITITNQVPLAPTVITIAATNVMGTSATINGSVNANGSSTTVTFNWGLTAAYGNTVNASPSHCYRQHPHGCFRKPLRTIALHDLPFPLCGCEHCRHHLWLRPDLHYLPASRSGRNHHGSRFRVPARAVLFTALQRFLMLPVITGQFPTGHPL